MSIEERLHGSNRNPRFGRPQPGTAMVMTITEIGLCTVVHTRTQTIEVRFMRLRLCERFWIVLRVFRALIQRRIIQVVQGSREWGFEQLCRSFTPRTPLALHFHGSTAHVAHVRRAPRSARVELVVMAHTSLGRSASLPHATGLPITTIRMVLFTTRT